MRDGTPEGPYDVNKMGWKSVALYIFGAVAGMMAILGIASAILLCVWWRLSRGSNTTAANSSGEQTREIDAEKAENDEEKVLVIMPGQSDPTFIAKIVISSSSST